MVQSEPAMLREAVARFDDPVKLEAAVLELQSHGFDRADISFIARDGMLGQHPASDHAATRRDRRGSGNVPHGAGREQRSGPGPHPGHQHGRGDRGLRCCGLHRRDGRHGAARRRARGGGGARRRCGRHGDRHGAGASERQFLDEQLDARRRHRLGAHARCRRRRARAFDPARTMAASTLHLHDDADDGVAARSWPRAAASAYSAGHARTLRLARHAGSSSRRPRSGSGKTVVTLALLRALRRRRRARRRGEGRTRLYRPGISRGGGGDALPQSRSLGDAAPDHCRATSPRSRRRDSCCAKA